MKLQREERSVEALIIFNRSSLGSLWKTFCELRLSADEDEDVDVDVDIGGIVDGTAILESRAFTTSWRNPLGAEERRRGRTCTSWHEFGTRHNFPR